MKTKKVNRYYCDHCRKSGGSAWHMRNHERGCTLNPKRRCGICGISDPLCQENIEELVDCLLEDIVEWISGNYQEYIGNGYWPTLGGGVGEIPIVRLREKTEGCPACILATIRQAAEFKVRKKEFVRKQQMAALEEDMKVFDRAGRIIAALFPPYLRG